MPDCNPQMEPAPPEWGVTVDRVIHSCVDWSLQSPLDFSPQADTQFVGDRVFGADVAWKGYLILYGQLILTKGPQKDGSTSSTCHCDDLPMMEGTLSWHRRGLTPQKSWEYHYPSLVARFRTILAICKLWYRRPLHRTSNVEKLPPCIC